MFKFENLNDSKAIFTIFIAGVLLRFGWLLYAKPVPVSDFATYRLLAENLLLLKQFGYPEPTAFRFPLYPAFLATLMLFGKSNFWLSLCNVVLSSLMIVVIYFLVKRITENDKIVATASALVCALNPTFVLFAPVLASEHLFAFLIFLTLLIIYSPDRSFGIKLFLAGITCGLSILTRGDGLFYLPVFLLSSTFVLLKYKKSLCYNFLIIIACSIIILPWYVRNLIHFGPGVGLSTSGGVAFYLSHFRPYGAEDQDGTELDGLNPVDAHKLGYKLAIEYLKDNPKDAIKHPIRSTIGLYKPSDYALIWSLRLPKQSGDEAWGFKKLDLYKLISNINLIAFTVILGLVILFFVYRLYISNRNYVIMLSMVLMNWFCYGLIFKGKARYRFVPEFVLCIFAAVTLIYLGRKAWNRIKKNRII